MLQYSVYIRHCASNENANVHEKRVIKSLPRAGMVSILRITDKQYGNILNYWGTTSEKLSSGPQQLEMF